MPSDTGIVTVAPRTAVTEPIVIVGRDAGAFVPPAEEGNADNSPDIIDTVAIATKNFAVILMFFPNAAIISTVLKSKELHSVLSL